MVFHGDDASLSLETAIRTSVPINSEVFSDDVSIGKHFQRPPLECMEPDPFLSSLYHPLHPGGIGPYPRVPSSVVPLIPKTSLLLSRDAKYPSDGSAPLKPSLIPLLTPPSPPVLPRSSKRVCTQSKALASVENGDDSILLSQRSNAKELRLAGDAPLTRAIPIPIPIPIPISISSNNLTSDRSPSSNRKVNANSNRLTSSRVVHEQEEKEEERSRSISNPSSSSTSDSSSSVTARQSNNVKEDFYMHFPLLDFPYKLIHQFAKVSSAQAQETFPNIKKSPVPKFRLAEQPLSVQRKSYKKENRCIHPNPLVICRTSDSQDFQILSGVVTVQLVDKDGKSLQDDRNSALQCVDGDLTHSLDKDLSASYSLKISRTSEGQLFRLKFLVFFHLYGVSDTLMEEILTTPFAVYSNKHNRNSRKGIYNNLVHSLVNCSPLQSTM